MFENTIQTNGTQSWKWVTISGRVFVDNSELDDFIVENEHDEKKSYTTNDAFEELARDKLLSVLPRSDDPFKFDSFEFPA